MPWEYDEQQFRTDANTFDAWADRYDELIPATAESETTVAALARLSPGKRILELAAGTGRIAIPLAELGFEVTALDSSSAMLDRLTARDTQGRVRTVVGDMRDWNVDRQFDLICLLLNGLYLLPDQEAQLACLRTAAAHLAPGGVLVTEGFVPPSRDAFRFNQATNTTFLATQPPEARLECSLHDPLDQRVRTQVISLTPTGAEFFPVEMRYVHPSELDLMARIAGLTLTARYGDWRSTPLGSVHTNCVSVFERVASE